MEKHTENDVTGQPEITDRPLVAEIAAKFRSGAFSEVDALLQASLDKEAHWKIVQSAVDLVYGKNHVFSQHGPQKRLTAAYSPVQQQMIFRKINELTACLSVAFGIELFLTSGTLLGLIRDGCIISYDDDVDTAYVSATHDYFNWALERRSIIKYLNQLPGTYAKDHLPGLIHVHTTLSDGVKFRFDLFSSILKSERFMEYPLDVLALEAKHILPLHRVDFLGVDVSIPSDPYTFLEANYGPGWKVPDPTFRFNWKLSGQQYGDKLNAMRTETPTLPWLKNEIAQRLTVSNVSDANQFYKYKLATLDHALKIDTTLTKVLIIGASSIELIRHCQDLQDLGRLEYAAVDALEPIDRPVGPYKAGTIMANPSCRVRSEESELNVYPGKYSTATESLSQFLARKIDIIYLNTPTKKQTVEALKEFEPFFAYRHLIIFDSFLYAHEKELIDGQYQGLNEWLSSGRSKIVRCKGRNDWTQVIFSSVFVGEES